VLDAQARLGWQRWLTSFLLAAVVCGRSLLALADPSPAFLVKDINTVPGGGFTVPDAPMRSIDGVTYFLGTTVESGTELRRSDGTAAGTQLVKDVYGGANNVFEMNGTLYFASFAGIQSLWKSDGSINLLNRGVAGFELAG
jgi:ELWxxDGT repeat protein